MDRSVNFRDTRLYPSMFLHFMPVLDFLKGEINPRDTRIYVDDGGLRRGEGGGKSYSGLCVYV